MADPISRLPVVSPSFPVNPAQPVDKGKDRTPEDRGTAKKRRRSVDREEDPDGPDSSDESPVIDEYI